MNTNRTIPGILRSQLSRKKPGVLKGPLSAKDRQRIKSIVGQKSSYNGPDNSWRAHLTKSKPTGRAARLAKKAAALNPHMAEQQFESLKPRMKAMAAEAWAGSWTLDGNELSGRIQLPAYGNLLTICQTPQERRLNITPGFEFSQSEQVALDIRFERKHLKFRPDYLEVSFVLSGSLSRAQARFFETRLKERLRRVLDSLIAPRTCLSTDLSWRSCYVEEQGGELAFGYEIQAPAHQLTSLMRKVGNLFGNLQEHSYPIQSWDLSRLLPPNWDPAPPPRESRWGSEW